MQFSGKLIDTQLSVSCNFLNLIDSLDGTISDDEIHAIVNFTDSTTTCITQLFSDTIDVTIHNYIDSEEHDAKVLFGGDTLEEYWINVDTGEIEDILNEEE